MERLLTTQEVCDKLKIARHTLYDLLSSRQLKATKVNRSWRIKPSDLDAFITRNADTAYIRRITQEPQSDDVDMASGVWPDPRNQNPRVSHSVMAEIRQRMLPGGDLENKRPAFIATTYDMSQTTMGRYMRTYGYMCRKRFCVKPTADNSVYCEEHSAAVPTVTQQTPATLEDIMARPERPPWLEPDTLVRWVDPTNAAEYQFTPFHIKAVDIDTSNTEWRVQTPTGHWYSAATVEPVIKQKPDWAVTGQWVRWLAGYWPPFPITAIEDSSTAPSGFITVASDGRWHDLGTFVPYQPSAGEVARHSFANMATALVQGFSTGYDKHKPTETVEPIPKPAPDAILVDAEPVSTPDLSNGKGVASSAALEAPSVVVVPDWAEDLFQAVSIFTEAEAAYHTALQAAQVLHYEAARADLKAAEKSRNEALELLQSSHAYAKRNREGVTTKKAKSRG